MNFLMKLLTGLFGEGLKAFFGQMDATAKQAQILQGQGDAAALAAAKKSQAVALEAIAERNTPKAGNTVLEGLRRPSARRSVQMGSIALLLILPMLSGCAGLFTPIVHIEAKTGGCEWVRGIYLQDASVDAIAGLINSPDKPTSDAATKDFQQISDHNKLYERYCPEEARSQDPSAAP